MIKKIDFDGYNQAEIQHIYEDGACACTVRQMEEGVCVKQDTNIIMMNGVHFTLTEEELEQLNPTEDATNLQPFIPN